MPGTEIPVRKLLGIALCVAVLLGVAVAVSFTLLAHWRLAPGGEGGSGALVDTIPEPRLQTAPQFEQRLGASLPPGLKLVDEAGRRVDWTALAASGRPIVLLPAYYRCDTLCGTVAHGALEALADTGLPLTAWHLLLFSIDPQDKPADARVLRAVYADYAAWARPAVFGAKPPDLRLLTGDAADTAALARSIGFDWRLPPGAAGQAVPQYAHPTGMVVLTPQGTVAKYMLGVRFDPAVLRSALVDAADGRVGTLADRLLLACAHLDPLAGAHNAQVAWLLRAIGLAVLGALAFWMWRHRAAPSRRPR
jgi:protein SCO1/2